MDESAQSLVRSQGPALEPLVNRLDLALQGHGCSSYVKTIYIGYQLGDEMVAALYPYLDHLELALALDETRTSEVLVDATHLTWRTMPVAAIVQSGADVEQCIPLIDEAVSRVLQGVHGVFRDSAYFQNAKTGRRFPKRRYDA